MFGKLRSKIKSNGETLFYTVPISIFFGLVYFCSLTFKYIEGDDAASIAFHALGRNTHLQRPYSAYQGMMDIFLYWLPADESVVRHVAVSFTAVSSVIAIMLVMDLIKGWLPSFRGFRATLTTVVILLSAPEIFYLSIGYIPSLTALCFVLTAHKLIKRLIASPDGMKFSVRHSGIFILSIIVFGIGTACRWDIGSYLIIIVADLIFDNSPSEKDLNNLEQIGDSGSRRFEVGKIFDYKRILLAALYGISAFSASILAIFLSGYDSKAIFDVLKLIGAEVTMLLLIFSSIGAYQTLFTPAFIIFFVTGFVWLAIRRTRTAIFIFITILPFLIYTSSREPKMMLPALPSFFLTAAAGINFLWFKVSKKYLVWVRAAAVIIIVLPWFVGVEVMSANSSWGPGFGIKTLDEPEDIDNGKSIIEDTAQGREVSVQNFKIRLGSGFAVPTSEGARPIGGHFYTLIFGGWKTLYEKLDEERISVLEKADSENINILEDERNSWLITKFLEDGYNTNDSREGFSTEGINQRFFFRDGKKICLQTLQSRSSLFKKDILDDLAGLSGNKKVILYSGYSSTIKKLKDTAPEAIEVIGPFSAVIDLEAFAKSDKLRD